MLKPFKPGVSPGDPENSHKLTQVSLIDEPPFTHMVWVEGEDNKWPEIRIVNKLNRKMRRSKLDAIHFNPQYDKETGRWFIKCWKKPEGAR